MKAKSSDQARTWLASMKASDDIFASINAGSALDLIQEQERKLNVLGAAFTRVKKERDQAWEALEKAREGLLEARRAPSGGDDAGYYCTHCGMPVPTEMVNMWDPVRNCKDKVRICLRCGEPIVELESVEAGTYMDI